MEDPARRTRELTPGARALRWTAELPWWAPLAGLLAAAVVVRFSTLTLQSLWYDEAFTPVHVLHPSLGATLSSVVHSENTPPLWYLLEWVLTRILGTGVVALRLLSAGAGVALVGVGWAIGGELGGRRSATILAGVIAVNPLFVWYSQEARAYELYALLAALGVLCFLRVRRDPNPRALALWAAASIAALLTHYFAVFLIAPQALLLLRPRDRVRAAVAIAAIAAVAIALIPLVLAQGGHGTQWIGRWPLSQRVIQIAGYYLLGTNGIVLGHGLLLLSALPVLSAVVLVALRPPDERRPALEILAVGVVAIALPFVLALAGADYLAPRNLIADYVPLSAALAAGLGSRAVGRAGLATAAVVCLAGAAVVTATDLDSRLQRGDWSALAAAIRDAPRAHAIVTVEDGATPLEYYLPHARLRYLSVHARIAVREVDLVGYAPLRADPAHPPTPAFTSAGKVDVHGLLVYRFTASHAQGISGRFLRSLAITDGQPSEVIAPASAR
ncbi:MAG: glycosyltransferase family 39 protein [Solirubrobacteraceae bacterium]